VKNTDVKVLHPGSKPKLDINLSLKSDWLIGKLITINASFTQLVFILC